MSGRNFVLLTCGILALGSLRTGGAEPSDLLQQGRRIAAERRKAIEEAGKISVLAGQDTTDTARGLLQVADSARHLYDRIAALRATFDRLDRQDQQLDEELHRLQQQLLVDTVSLTLMQTELLPPDSADRIAAAAMAEAAADRAIRAIASGAPARRAMLRMKVEAILRGGQIARAAEQLKSLVQQTDQTLSPEILALQVRIDIAQDNRDQAAARLSSYYGSEPASAPESSELDLARLEYLAKYNSAMTGAWLDQIEQRNGRDVRRRGEAILLHRLGDDASAVNPAEVAVLGRNWLRRGQSDRGGALLAAAAAAERDPDRAVRHAIESAAALESAGRAELAAQILIETAAARPAAANADKAHLQGIYLLSPRGGEATEELLRQHLQRWPSGPVAVEAGRWYRRLASVSLDRQALAGLPPAAQNEDPFITALILFRQQGTISPPLESVPPQLAADAARRLMQDGRKDPQLRGTISELIDRWQQHLPGEFAHEGEQAFAAAERLLWAGKIKAAMTALEALTATAADRASAMARGAQMLAGAESAAARQEAIRWWDALAAGSPTGSRHWHQAKISAIQLLRKLGRREEAVTRAKYILLTEPDLDPDIRRQYQRFSQ